MNYVFSLFLVVALALMICSDAALDDTNSMDCMGGTACHSKSAAEHEVGTRREGGVGSDIYTISLQSNQSQQSVHPHYAHVLRAHTYHDGVGTALQTDTCHHILHRIVPVLCNTTKYFGYYAYKLFNEMTLDDFNGSSSPIVKRFPIHHGRSAVTAMVENLRAVNWSEAEVQDSIWAYGIYRNTFLIKPRVFLKLARWMTRLIEAVEESSSVTELFNIEAGYPANRETAMRVFGVPHYLLHCFVMERMVAVVLDHIKANVHPKTFDYVLRDAFPHLID